MLFKKLVSIVLFAGVVSGCATTPKLDESRLSEGASMMREFKLASDKELAELQVSSDAHQAELQKKGNSGGSIVDLAIGTGVAESAVTAMTTGGLVNPSKFIDKDFLGFYAADVLTGKGMRGHKWGYNYFFVKDKGCDDRSCANRALKDFYYALVDEYKAFAATQSDLVVTEHDFSGSKPIFDSVEGFVVTNKSGKRDRIKALGVRNFDTLSDDDDVYIWGNTKPADFQDNVGFIGVDFEKLTSMLERASKASPNVVVFRGIDLNAIKKGEACRGGVFVAGGRLVEIPEIGCR